jgi:hypothetical protein
MIIAKMVSENLFFARSGFVFRDFFFSFFFSWRTMAMTARLWLIGVFLPQLQHLMPRWALLLFLPLSKRFLLTNNPTTIREAERKLHLQTYGPVADLCNLPISGQHDGKSKDDC